MKWRLLVVLVFSISSVVVSGCGGQMADGPGQALSPDDPAAGGDVPFLAPGPAADPDSPAGAAPAAAPSRRAPGPLASGVEDPCKDVRRVKVEAAEVVCTVGEACSGALTVTRGSESYRWRDGTPAALPVGLAWDADDFSFSGTPTAAGETTVKVQIDDADCEGKGGKAKFTIKAQDRMRVEVTNPSPPPPPPTLHQTLSLDANSVQKQDEDVRGGGGGVVFESSCPENQVVSRIDFRSGGYIDQIQISCEPVATLDQTGVDPVAEEAHGGPGGVASSIAAPLGFAFVGWNVRSGGYVDALEPYASRVTDSGVNNAVEWFGGKYGGTGGNDWQEIRCGGDFVLTGIRGRSGGYVDQIAPICTKVNVIASKPSTSFALGRNGRTHKTERGNNGGTDCVLSCNERDSDGMVAGFAWGGGGTNGSLRYIELICADLESDGSTDTASAWSAGSCGGGGPGSKPLFPKGYAATKIKYSTGGRLDSITAIIEPASLFRDPLAPLWGRDGTPDVAATPARMGGGGGNPKAPLACNEGEVLTGITFASGGDVDDIISFTCAPVN